MCLGCFHKYTDEPVINERVEAAVGLLNTAGDDAHWTMLLHVIVEDDNVDDWFFDFEDEDTGADTKQRYDEAEPWEREIFDALMPLSEAERATVIALHGGYFGGVAPSSFPTDYPYLASLGFVVG